MVQRENRRSAFWQMAEQLDPTRTSLSWTNLSKMDRVGGAVPPNLREWASIARECTAAFVEEVQNLKPGVIVLATSDIYANDVADVLNQLEFSRNHVGFNDKLARVYAKSRSYVVTTKHPQGWLAVDRDKVVELIRCLYAKAQAGKLS
jgi:hypothetical protein